MSVCVQTSVWTQVSLLSGTHRGAGRQVPACRPVPRPPEAGGGPTCPHPPDAGCHPPSETAAHTGVWGTVPRPPASPQKPRVRCPLRLAGQVFLSGGMSTQALHPPAKWTLYLTGVENPQEAPLLLWSSGLQQAFWLRVPCQVRGLQALSTGQRRGGWACSPQGQVL